MSAIRVALYHDFAEERLFGVRFYAERLRAALAGRCDVVDVYPRPRSAGASSRLATWIVKSVLYPIEARGVAADVHHVLDQSHADLLRALPAKRAVATCHDLEGWSRGSALRRALYRRRVGKLRRAARVIAVSEFAARSVCERLGIPRERVVVVRNPLERFFLESPDPAESAAVLERLGLAARGFVLHVGASWPYKNLEGAIDALGLVGRRRTAPPLVKVGAPLTPAQRARAEGRGVRVIELGERPSVELRAIYRGAALLLQPSWEEGYGWPVAEAMAAGSPVVASAAGALAEVAGGAAVEVDPADADNIAAGIARVLDDAAFADDLRARGRARAEELARGDFGGEIAAVYASVAAEAAA